MSEEDFLSTEPLADIPLPSLDIPLPSLLQLHSVNNSFSGLDDSVDITNSMGTLQLHDLSPVQRSWPETFFPFWVVVFSVMGKLVFMYMYDVHMQGFDFWNSIKTWCSEWNIYNRVELYEMEKNTY